MPVTPGKNKANRQVADVDIRFKKTMEPFLYFDLANTTTVSTSGSNVFAMGAGSRRVGFQDPMEGTLAITAQVTPFALYALYSDGTIENTATHAVKTTVTCETAGTLTLPIATGDTVVAGSVFVYPEGAYGDSAQKIEVTVTGTTVTAEGFTADTSYDVGFVVTRTSGVQNVALNSTRIPRDYYITMKTVEKDEDDVLTPYVITVHKATIQRNLELAFSSEGDPGTITVTFDLLEDKSKKFIEITELTTEAY
jgi:hypothetical protein